jgi:undecaprenyl diphosphate synthase
METVMAEAEFHDERIDMSRLPRHIAIIMDGNGRWAERHGKPRVAGHEAGAAGVRRSIELCRQLGVPALSLYAFSTENWRRADEEVNALFTLMSKYIHLEINELHANDIRIRFMGRMDRLPEEARKDLQYCLDLTAENRSLTVNVAINYGGRAELVDAAKAFARDVSEGIVDLDSLEEESFARYLYVPEHPEVDLLIRTSGEMRVSNFMLWQVSYAEILAPDVLWPDFGKQELADAIVQYQQRSRRFGARP